MKYIILLVALCSCASQKNLKAQKDGALTNTTVIPIDTMPKENGTMKVRRYQPPGKRMKTSNPEPVRQRLD
jgi:hypothetical protein